MSSRPWGRLSLLAAGALCCAAAGIKTALVPIPADLGKQCLRSLSMFFWVSAAWLVLVTISTTVVHERYAAVRLALRKRPWFRRLHFFGVLFLISLLWGVTGILWTTQPECNTLQDPNRWLLLCAMGVASFFLVGSLYCLLRAVLVSVQDLPAGQETIPALVCIRCSCCSIALKRTLIVGPVALLSIVNGISWAQSSQSHATNSCSSLYSTYFAVATLLLLLVVVTMLCGLYGDSMTIDKDIPEKDEPSERNKKSIRRRQCRSRVLWCLVLLQVAAIGWAIHGLKWVSTRGSQADAESVAVSWTISKCNRTAPAHAHGVLTSAIELLVVGCILLTGTLCCRLEDFFLPPSNSTRTSGPNPLKRDSRSSSATEINPMTIV